MAAGGWQGHKNIMAMAHDMHPVVGRPSYALLDVTPPWAQQDRTDGSLEPHQGGSPHPTSTARHRGLRLRLRVSLRLRLRVAISASRRNILDV